MAEQKLDSEHQARVLEWLCDGKGDTEIARLLASECGVVCTRENIKYYRDKWAEEVDEAETGRLEAAKRRGWGTASQRLRALFKIADKCEADIDYLNGSQIAKYGIGKELRETQAAIAKELGQDKAQRLELTGANGGPVALDVSVGVEDVLANDAATELACQLAEELASPGEAHPGDVCEGDK